eukprot:541167-Prymnesium_polylepis.1
MHRARVCCGSWAGVKYPGTSQRVGANAGPQQRLVDLLTTVGVVGGRYTRLGADAPMRRVHLMGRFEEIVKPLSSRFGARA